MVRPSTGKRRWGKRPSEAESVSLQREGVERPLPVGRKARARRDPLQKGALVGALLCAGLSGSSREAIALERQSLPDGAGLSLILEACVQCHDLKPIVAQRKTAEAWRRTVDEMVWRGAPLLGNEPEAVTRYLVASFPRRVSISEMKEEGVAIPDQHPDKDEGAQYLPPGEGRTLVLQACVGCHDLKPIATERKTAEGWRRSVSQMIRLGARLMGSEAEVVGNYLAASFGPGAPIPDGLKTPPGQGRAQEEKQPRPRPQRSPWAERGRWRDLQPGAYALGSEE